jgi:uncharacterized protein YjbI with pentapeptide repeats
MNTNTTKKMLTKLLGLRFDMSHDAPLDLSGLRISDMVTKNINFEKANLSHTTFVNCDYRNIRLDSTICDHTVFKNCKINTLMAFNTNLNGIQFIDTELKQFTFDNCRFEKVEGLQNMQLSHARLIDCIFIETKFTNNDLSNALLANVKFIKCNLSNSDFSTVRCVNVQFDQDCILKKTRWLWSFIKDCTFDYSDAQYANFYGSNILNSHFESTDLTEANLKECFITNTKFDYANVQGILLWNANFDALAFKLSLNKSPYLEKEIFWRYHPGVKYEQLEEELDDHEYIKIPRKGANQ